MAESFGRRQIIGIIAIVLAGAALAYRFSAAGAANNPLENQRWFYDLQTGELFTHDATAIPPVPAPSGADGVRAHLYACGACPPDGKGDIAYLEMYTDEGKDYLSNEVVNTQQPNPGAAAREPQGAHLVAEPGEKLKWIDYRASAAAPIQDVASHCPDGRAQLCVPR